MAAIQKGWGPKLTGRLADYANASKGTVLLGDIQAHMIKEHAKPSDRRQDIVHPSETSKESWCPRATYYRIEACRAASDPFLKPAESTGVQLLNIFDEGHNIHHKWQTRIREMGDLWGSWQCTHSKCYEYYWNTLCPDICDECGGDSFIYREVPLKSEKYLIHGHADGAVPRLNALIEIKSVGPGTVRMEASEVYARNVEGSKIDLQSLWKDIKEPFPSHIKQGQLYLALCDLMGLPFDNIIFIYESKFNQGVKEFVVKYDSAVSSKVLEYCRQIVNSLRGDGTVPPCPTESCKDCEKYSGTAKSGTEGLGRAIKPDSQEPETNSGPIRRSSRPSTRLVRPS